MEKDGKKLVEYEKSVRQGFLFLFQNNQSGRVQQFL